MQYQVMIKTFQLLAIMFMIALFNMNVIAFDTNLDFRVVLKLKVYLGDKPANNDVADSVYIKVVEINSRTKNEHLEESGLFNIELGLGKHYLIYVSRKGYGTHFFEFSTMGVEPEMKLMFYVDITLGQELKFARYSTGHPLNHFRYNSKEKGRYINISRGTIITFDNKNKG